MTLAEAIPGDNTSKGKVGPVDHVLKRGVGYWIFEPQRS